MFVGKFSAIALLFLVASAFRVKPKKRVKSTAKAPAAKIGGIFAYAAPGTADPAFQNPRGGPCFPGIRSAVVEKQSFLQYADTATTVTGVIGFRHPWMDFKLIDWGNPNLDELYSCAQEGEETGNRPRGLSRIALHDRQGYADRMRNKDLGWAHVHPALSDVGIPASYIESRSEAAALGAQFGWSLIGSAVDNGGPLYVGRQVSHLFQNASSGECMLTFQGSSSFEDWTANLNLRKVGFCGYAPAAMALEANETTILSAGQSLVHAGFRDVLMQIVTNGDWQNDVRSKFSSCSQVYVTGHSQGAAQAELFGACVQQGLQPGQDGYEEHYKWMGW